MTELTATLLIGACTSKCGHCRNGAFTKDTHHRRIASGMATPDPRARP